MSAVDTVMPELLSVNRGKSLWHIYLQFIKVRNANVIDRYVQEVFTRGHYTLLM